MVKINMQMPKSCSDCGFSSFDRDDWNCYCEFLDLEINYYERLENCPLIDESDQICCNCNHSEKDYGKVLSCYYWDYEEGMSPNKVYASDFCSNWEKIDK